MVHHPLSLTDMPPGSGPLTTNSLSIKLQSSVARHCRTIVHSNQLSGSMQSLSKLLAIRHFCLISLFHGPTRPNLGRQLHTRPSAFRPSHLGLMGGPGARDTALTGFDLIGATMHSLPGPCIPPYGNPSPCMSLLPLNDYSINCPYGLATKFGLCP